MQDIHIKTRCFVNLYDKVSVSRQTYNKVRTIYRRRGKVIKRNKYINILLNLPPNSKWYEYKGRILIFRPFHNIASFVISGNKIYNPFIACGAIYYHNQNHYPKTPLDIHVFISKYYINFEKASFLDNDKEQVLNLLKKWA